ncbi:MAG TPA: MBL fold metallo-hydrolase [Vicinamibacterales bacterium]
MTRIRLTHVGGPTLLLEFGGHRFLTDPTFSPPGDYQSGAVVLTKLAAPAVAPEVIGKVDAVLLSHDHHADNLDPAGREYLPNAGVVLTTKAGAERLGAPAVGLAPWEDHMVDGVRVTATPARHGPAGFEHIAGDVIGFALAEGEDDLVYVTGDTVFFDGMRDVAHRRKPRLVVAFAGAARTRGPFDLTLDTNGMLELAHVFPQAKIVVIHAEGWKHFTESFDDVRRAFEALNRGDRLVPLAPGVPHELAL